MIATAELLTDSPTNTLTLPSTEAHSVPTARHFADEQLTRWGIGEDERDSAALVIGELAANAIQHGHADMTLRLSIDEEDLLVITVIDSGPEVVRESPRSELPDDEHGRGTDMVQYVAVWVVIEDTPEGRRVSAALAIA